MKTLKTLTAAILIILSASAFAIDKKKNEKLLMDYTVKKYIEAVSLGQLKGVANIFDNEVKMTMTVHNRVVNYGKSEIMTLLKFAENTEQNCKTEYRMLERTPSNALAKVTMKYDGFSKINFISMANTTDGWKITSITTSID